MEEKTSQEELFNKIMSLTPITEIKKIKNDKTISMSRKEYILINGNTINFYDFKAHLDTIQKRNYLNNFCLNEISKDCDNKKVLTNEELASLKKNNRTYHPNFLIHCEYFLFSTKTIFDTILNMIKYIFPEKTHRGFGEIEKWTEEDLMKKLIGDLDWFIKFNARRNMLTHDTIAGISSNINYGAKYGIITYSKRNLGIRKKGERGEDIFQLPSYLQECFTKTDKTINNFYNLLLRQKIIGKIAS